MALVAASFSFFFFNDTATTEIYTLSLHDALPICSIRRQQFRQPAFLLRHTDNVAKKFQRSEEHTSELQSPCNLVCRLLLEKKKKIHYLCRIRALHTISQPHHDRPTVSSL